MQKTRGVTLVELMLVLVVIAVLILMSVRYYTVVRENAKVTQAITRIDLAVDASYKWSIQKNQKDFSGINAQELITAGLLTEQDIKNPWGGGDDLTVSANANTRQFVKVGFSDIPKTACMSLQQKFMDKVQIINKKSESHCSLQPGKWDFWGVF